MSETFRSEDQIALIGGGPSGLAGARALQRRGLPFQGFEAHDDLGGLWNLANPRARAYASLRMLTSKQTTAFSDLPMPAGCPDYPSQADALRYLQDYADSFDLRRHFCFGTLVRRVEPVSEMPDSLWRVTADDGSASVVADYKGVVIANGIHAEPHVPRFPGRFDGELMHAAAYRDADHLAGRRVLIVGGGNSACDLAVDAAATASAVTLSVRRGAYLWPRYLGGRPADLAAPWWRHLPRPLRLRAAARQLRRTPGQLEQHGFPPPTHALDELPPLSNDDLLPLLARGEIEVRGETMRMDGDTVHFADGRQGRFDLVIAATGYKLHYPFLRAELLNWHGPAPRLYLNIFAPHYQRLAVIGMFEGQGLGWRDRQAQAELVAAYLAAQTRQPGRAAAFAALARGPLPDLRGGGRAPRLDRLAHAVDAPTYRRALQRAAGVLAD
jgi:hypothetical protein